jgi:hypothetical protein
MVELKDLIPEIASFVVGLILTAFGVPSVTDIGIIIISAFQNAINATPNAPSQINSISSMYIITLRSLGAFLEIEVPLRVLIWFSGRGRGNYSY